MSQTVPQGHLHPITQTIREISGILAELGYEVALGPELESEFYNFDALNVPKDHPSRDMQDTFWIKADKTGGHDKATKDAMDSKGRRLLTTQTSAIQIRYMEEKIKAGLKPPFRIVAPGRVFRNEATDATHEAQFYQLEGLFVDKKVSLAELKGTLEKVFKKIFGEKSEIRFRPSYFPFVEPAVEVDVKWVKEGEDPRWLEVLGAGLVHPYVFASVGIDSNEWQCFAFAFGIDRIVMLKYGINDIRLLYNGDLRFVNQF